MDMALVPSDVARWWRHSFDASAAGCLGWAADVMYDALMIARCTCCFPSPYIGAPLYDSGVIPSALRVLSGVCRRSRFNVLSPLSCDLAIDFAV